MAVADSGPMFPSSMASAPVSSLDRAVALSWPRAGSHRLPWHDRLRELVS
jgi:hypothetical protein